MYLVNVNEFSGKKNQEVHDLKILWASGCFSITHGCEDSSTRQSKRSEIEVAEVKYLFKGI